MMVLTGEGKKRNSVQQQIQEKEFLGDILWVTTRIGLYVLMLKKNKTHWFSPTVQICSTVFPL